MALQGFVQWPIQHSEVTKSMCVHFGTLQVWLPFGLGSVPLTVMLNAIQQSLP